MTTTPAPTTPEALTELIRQSVYAAYRRAYLRGVRFSVWRLTDAQGRRTAAKDRT